MNGNKMLQTMTTKQARALTDKISRKVGELWPLMREAYERKAWDALGYGSWREYATQEFNVSQSRAYQLLDQARVVALIQEASNSTDVEISEADARAIKPIIKDVAKQVHAKVSAGSSPTDATNEAIKAARVAMRNSTDVEKQAKRAAQKVNSSVQVESDSTGKRKSAPAKDFFDSVNPPIHAENADTENRDNPTLADLVDELQRENDTLRRENEALKSTMDADDLRAELAKARRMVDHCRREQGVAMDNAAKSQERERYIVRMLRRCAKAVGVKDPSHTDPRDIVKAVEARAREGVPA